MEHIEAIKQHEAALQRAVTVWIVTGLLFMLLPGTFLGAWNLIAISGAHSASGLDPSWLQAHGHAQIFGWIGTFILGIGFYSLSKMGGAGRFAVNRAWLSWALWTAGVSLRWATNLWEWQWRSLLPLSAVLELAGFLIFFLTVSRHRAPKTAPASGTLESRVWMGAVIAGSLGFLLSLAANLFVTVQAAQHGSGPAIPHVVNQRLLALFTWAFPVVTIWGFSARWLPVFLGLPNPASGLLAAAILVNAAAVAGALLGVWIPASLLFLAGATLAACAVRVFQRSVRPAKITGVHPSFPAFVRVAYVWLLASAVLTLAAAAWDQAGGLWGASRHALTVGYIATMVFAIGQRILPAFCGMRLLFNSRLMFASLALLNAGCTLRVVSEVGAYEGYLPSLWPLLPVSAVIEMTAVTFFAVNLGLTFLQPPAHLREQVAAATG
ncbi:MAG: NnrS family protein [Bryobacterales bacterium]|nr:NnrS family protein [Bryobacterales bacterium]